MFCLSLPVYQIPPVDCALFAYDLGFAPTALFTRQIAHDHAQAEPGGQFNCTGLPAHEDVFAYAIAALTALMLRAMDQRESVFGWGLLLDHLRH